MDQKTLTYEQQEANRKDRLAEVGTMPPCPFCKKPRVERSDYIRCLPCGINWLLEESHLPNYLDRNPASCRAEARRLADNVGGQQQGKAE